MDGGAEHVSPGVIAGETRSNLAERYSSVGKSLETVYQAITPKQESKRWITRIREGHFRTPKDTRANDTLFRMSESFQSRFPDISQQDLVVEGADQFLQKLAESFDPAESVRTPHVRIQRFFDSFPDNMLGSLNEEVTADMVKDMFQIGSDAIDAHMKKIAGYDPDERAMRASMGNMVNENLAQIVELFSNQLPRAINNAGSARNALLEKVKRTAKHRDLTDLENMLNFYRAGVYEPSASTLANMAALQARIAEIDPHADTSSSPFNYADREPWKGDSVMGSESRSPSWRDLADMVRCTEEDDLEYGIIFSKDLQNESHWIDYKRGRDFGEVSNGNDKRRKDPIFFHVHPAHFSPKTPAVTQQSRELTSPLVSGGDLHNNDHGGGYFNIVTANGITFQTGSEKYDLLPQGVEDHDSSQDVYVIESGDNAGRWFREVEQTGDKKRELLQNIKEARDSFVYSIYEPVSKRKRYFIHIPWDKIDGDINLEQVLYGTGLQDLVRKMDNLPQIPVAPNVKEGLALAA